MTTETETETKPECTEDDLHRIVQNTISIVLRRAGHQIDSDKWIHGPVVYGYDDGNCFWQKCNREECNWHFSIEKEWDIAQRISFITSGLLVEQIFMYSFSREITESRTLFEITVGPDATLVDKYVLENKQFHLDDSLLNTFLLTCKSVLCKRLQNFI